MLRLFTKMPLQGWLTVPDGDAGGGLTAASHGHISARRVMTLSRVVPPAEDASALVFTEEPTEGALTRVALALIRDDAATQQPPTHPLATKLANAQKRPNQRVAQALNDHLGAYKQLTIRGTLWPTDADDVNGDTPAWLVFDVREAIAGVAEPGDLVVVQYGQPDAMVPDFGLETQVFQFGELNGDAGSSEAYGMVVQPFPRTVGSA